MTTARFHFRGFVQPQVGDEIVPTPALLSLTFNGDLIREQMYPSVSEIRPSLGAKTEIPDPLAAPCTRSTKLG